MLAHLKGMLCIAKYARVGLTLQQHLLSCAVQDCTTEAASDEFHLP